MRASATTSPTTRRVELGGHTLALTEVGDGPPLVLLHAAPAWSYIYREFLAALSGRYHCIAVDLPGFGFAPEPTTELSLAQSSQLVAQLIRELDMRDLTLVVHDSAGCIGLGAVAGMPERVRGLVLTDTFAWPLRDDFPRVRRVLRLVTTWPLSLLQTRLNLIPWAAVATARGDVPSAEGRREFLGGFASRARRARVLRQFRGLLGETTFLESVEAAILRDLAAKPALVMFGANDPARQAGFETRWREMLIDAEFRVLPAQAHFPHFGAAAEMCAHILEWASAQDQRRESGVGESAA
jgi:haloalkane dehalogenase